MSVNVLVTIRSEPLDVVCHTAIAVPKLLIATWGLLEFVADSMETKLQVPEILVDDSIKLILVHTATAVPLVVTAKEILSAPIAEIMEMLLQLPPKGWVAETTSVFSIQMAVTFPLESTASFGAEAELRGLEMVTGALQLPPVDKMLALIKLFSTQTAVALLLLSMTTA